MADQTPGLHWEGRTTWEAQTPGGMASRSRALGLATSCARQAPGWAPAQLALGHLKCLLKPHTPTQAALLEPHLSGRQFTLAIRMVRSGEPVWSPTVTPLSGTLEAKVPPGDAPNEDAYQSSTSSPRYKARLLDRSAADGARQSTSAIQHHYA